MRSLYPKCKGRFKYSLRISSLSVYTQRREERERKKNMPCSFAAPYPSVSWKSTSPLLLDTSHNPKKLVVGGPAKYIKNIKNREVKLGKI